ncbi:MAG: TatD family hydrolase [Verrucomicrobiota bacterium]|nr:TatD family hydrolase [Verrucomicrobiota bacterium]
MDFFDSHAHLTSPDLLPYLPSLLERAKEAHVSHIVNICTDEESLRTGLEWAKKQPQLYTAGATPPHDVEEKGDKEFPLFAEAAKKKELLAIGETGLDYYSVSTPKAIQEKFLVRYLHLAKETQLPLLFHCRNAFADLFTIVSQEYSGPALIHCFTGSLQEAETALQLGWHLSFSGIITFKKSEELRKVVKEVPLSRILLETDAPYLAPQSHRGHLNEPSFLPETAHCIAEVKGVSIEEVAAVTSFNAKHFFKIDL